MKLSTNLQLQKLFLLLSVKRGCSFTDLRAFHWRAWAQWGPDELNPRLSKQDLSDRDRATMGAHTKQSQLVTENHYISSHKAVWNEKKNDFLALFCLYEKNLTCSESHIFLRKSRFHRYVCVVPVGFNASKRMWDCRKGENYLNGMKYK